MGVFVLSQVTRPIVAISKFSFTEPVSVKAAALLKSGPSYKLRIVFYTHWSKILCLQITIEFH